MHGTCIREPENPRVMLISRSLPRDSAFLLSWLSLQLRFSFAQDSKTTPEDSTPTTSSSYNVFSAIASSSPDGGTFGIEPGNVASNPTSQAAQNDAGASGTDQGGLNLSTGDTIAIIVIVSLVVVIGSKPPHHPLLVCRLNLMFSKLRLLFCSI